MGPAFLQGLIYEDGSWFGDLPASLNFRIVPDEERLVLVLDEGDAYKVKRLLVSPQGQFSLQSHHRRAEHWMVVEGEATVTLGEEKRILTRG